VHPYGAAGVADVNVPAGEVDVDPATSAFDGDVAAGAGDPDCSADHPGGEVTAGCLHCHVPLDIAEGDLAAGGRATEAGEPAAAGDLGRRRAGGEHGAGRQRHPEVELGVAPGALWSADAEAVAGEVDIGGASEGLWRRQGIISAASWSRRR
jgi:hypothetical protein